MVVFKQGEIEIVFYSFKSFETLGFFFSQHFAESFKAFGFLFSSITLFIIMASTFDVQSIEKLNGNNFYTWKMNLMEFFLHEKEF